MSSRAIIKTDESQIRELMQNWVRAVRSRDMDAILKHHAPEILLFDVPPPVQTKGLDAYRRSWDVFFDWFGDSGVFELSELSITAGHDVAFSTGLIRCAGSDTSKNREELAVRLTVGYRKIDGQWIVAHEHHSEPSVD